MKNQEPPSAAKEEYYSYDEHSQVSKDIKILAEVEKIWIVFDDDLNGRISYHELTKYLRETVYPQLRLDQKQIDHIFNNLDLNCDGEIDKSEMSLFVNQLYLSDHFHSASEAYFLSLEQAKKGGSQNKDCNEQVD